MRPTEKERDRRACVHVVALIETPRRFTPLLFAAWFVVIPLSVLICLAQSGTAQGPSDSVREPDALVYVEDDDPEIRARIARAREASASGRLADAIDAWIEVLEDPRGQLVEWGPRTHSSVATTARRALADLPPEGIAMIEARFGEALEARLAEATAGFDAKALAELSRGVPTRATRRAAIRLADLRLESGDHSGALRALHTLRMTYGELPADVPAAAVDARIAFARARLGEPVFVDPLAPLPTDAKARVRGEDIELAEYVRALANDATGGEEPWRTFAGDFAHRGLTTRPVLGSDAARASADPAESVGRGPGGAIAARGASASPKWVFEGLPGTKDIEAPDERPLRSPEQEPNPIQPMHPLVTEELVIAYNKSSVVALRREDGSAAWQRDLDSIGAAPPGEARYLR